MNPILLATLAVLITGFSSDARAEATWFCEEGASEKSDRLITACGIGTDGEEQAARKKALAAAFDELDAVCGKSADCKNFELEIDPLRNSCRKEGSKYKCHRAIRATITDAKRKEPFLQGETLKNDREKIEVTVKVDAKDLGVLSSKQPPKCKADLAPLARAALDISTHEKQTAMTAEAVRVPFSDECAAIHYKILSILSRAGLELTLYTDFIMDTLKSIDDPAGDERAYWILDYLQRVGPMSDAQWMTALEVIKKSRTHTLYRLLPRIFFDQAAGEKARKTEKHRVDLFVEAVQRKQIGKPLPIEIDEAMVLMLRALKGHHTRKRPWLVLHAFEKHRKLLQLGAPQKITKSLKSLYRDIDDPAMKSKANEWIAELVKNAKPSYELSREIEPYLEDFGQSIRKEDDEEDDGIARIEMFNRQRADFVRIAGPNLGKNLALTRQDYERRKRTLLCLELQISCEELVPDAARLSKLLKSKRVQKRLEAIEILIKMPKLAARLESDLIATLRDIDEGRLENGNNIMNRTLLALAEIPTQDRATLKLIVDLKLRSRLSLQDVRKSLGPGLEPYLLDELKNKNTRHHHSIVRELNDFPRLSKATCAYLETLKGPEQPYFIRDGAEKAKQKCQ